MTIKDRAHMLRSANSTDSCNIECNDTRIQDSVASLAARKHKRLFLTLPLLCQ